MPSKQDRKVHAGDVQSHWCGQLFDEKRMPQGFMVFRTFCNENRILSKKYRDAFLAYVKKGQPDLLKLTGEYLDTAFKEYNGGSQTIVGQ